MNKVLITHIMYIRKAIGVALNKLVDGENIIQITVTNANGNILYPNELHIDKSTVIDSYGISDINKHSLQGVWIPIDDFPLYYEHERSNQ